MLNPLVLLVATTAPPTETVTSATQAAPAVPQAFTCNVCVPVLGAEILLLIELPLWVVVCELLSNE
jgi:hypothetical protein